MQKKRRDRVLFILVLLILIPFFASLVSAQCVTPDLDNTLVDQDIILCYDTYYRNDTDRNGVFNFSVDDVVLDCNGSSFIGNGSGSGLFILEQHNITVKNCTFANYTHGANLEKANDSALLHDSFFNNSIGMAIPEALRLLIHDNHLTDNFHGMNITHLSDSAINHTDISNNRGRGILTSDMNLTNITGCTISGNKIGIDLQGNNNTVKSSHLYGNDLIGIMMAGLTYNNIFFLNNFTDNHVHANSTVLEPFPISNRFFDNSTGVPHGNYWDDIKSVDVTDKDLDGFGDSGPEYPYNSSYGNVVGNVYDYGPILDWKRATNNPPVLSSSVLAGLYLTNYTHENLTLSADGYDIDGDNITYFGEWYRDSEIFVAEMWDATYNSGGTDDYAWGIAVDPLGNVYTAGEVSVGATPDFQIVKYDAGGNILWTEDYDGGYDDSIYAVTTDAAGDVYFTGESHNGTKYTMLTFKYNSTGDYQFNMTYDSGGSNNDVPTGIVVDSEGNIYVGGFSYIDGTNKNDFVIFKYDDTGSYIWDVNFDSGGQDYAWDLAIDDSDNLYISGGAETGGDSDILVVKYNSSGDYQWNATYDSGGEDDYGWRVDADDSGNVYVTGQVNGSGDYDIITVKYGRGGNYNWDVTYDSGGDDYAAGLAVDSLGYIYFSGVSDLGVSDNLMTFKYNDEGKQIWNITKAGGGEAWATEVDASGNIYVAGYVASGVDYDLSTVKYKDGFISDNNHDGVALADTLTSIFTSAGETWQACVTPYDGYDLGIEVCSNEVTIRSCMAPVLDNTPLTGDTVLCPGTYPINDTDANGIFNFTSDNIILDCNGSLIIGGGGASDAYGIYANGLSGITIEKCNVTDYSPAIFLNNTNNSRILNSLGNSSWERGIFILSSSNNSIVNSTGYAAESYGISLEASSNNSILNSTGQASNNDYGIYLEDSSYNKIFNCTGIAQDQGLMLDYGSNHNNISGMIAKAGYYAVEFYNSSYNVITDSLMNSSPNYDALYIGDASNYNTIIGSTIYSSERWGVEIISSSGTVIRDSDIHANGRYGIYLYNATGANFTNLSVGASYDVIYDGYATDNRFADITIDNNQLSFFGQNFSLSNITDVPPDPIGYLNISHYLNITNTSGDSWIYINFSYNESDLGGVDESTLQIWKYNSSAGEWINDSFFESKGVDTLNKVVWANITYFGSLFAPMGVEFGPCLNISNLSANGITDNFLINANTLICPGTYQVNDTDENGIFNFTANDTILDCNGSNFIGNNHFVEGVASRGIGVRLTDRSGIELRSCNFDYFNYGIQITGTSSGNYLHNNSVNRSRTLDLSIDVNAPVGICGNRIENNTGSGGYPLLFYNNTVNLADKRASMMVLCNADHSIINNVTVGDSGALANNQLALIYTDNATLTNINSSNNFYGLNFVKSEGNRISDSIFMDNSQHDVNRLLQSSHQNLTNVNGSRGKPIGWYNYSVNLADMEFSQLILNYADYSNLTNITVRGTDLGINNGLSLYHTSHATLDSINVSRTRAGLVLTDSDYNNISDSFFYGNHRPIYIFTGSDNNSIFNNTLLSNTNGLLIGTDSGNNTIFFNNFSGTSRVHASSGDSSNMFYINDGGVFKGNYWSDVFTNLLLINDSDSDGFGDSGIEYPYSQANYGYVGSLVVDKGPILGLGHQYPACRTLRGDNVYLNENTVICRDDYMINDTDDNGVVIINTSDIFVDCNGSSLTGGDDTGSKGFFFRNSSVNVTSCTISNYSQSVYLDDTQDVMLVDSSFNGTVDDVYSNASSVMTNHLVNCSFVDLNTDGLSSANVSWYLDVSVSNSSGPLPGANVTARNNIGSKVFDELTNSSGQIARKILTEYIKNSTATVYQTNYTVEASSIGYAAQSKQLNITGYAEMTFIMSEFFPLTLVDWYTGYYGDKWFAGGENETVTLVFENNASNTASFNVTTVWPDNFTINIGEYYHCSLRPLGGGVTASIDPRWIKCEANDTQYYVEPSETGNFTFTVTARNPSYDKEYEWNITVNDNETFSEYRAGFNVSVDVEYPGYPAALTHPDFDDTAVFINWSAGVDTGSGVGYYKIYIDDVLNASTPDNRTNHTLSLGDGNHSIRIATVDKAYHENMSPILGYTFVDTTVPVITLLDPSPANQTYAQDTSYIFNWSVADNQDNLLDCGLYINGALNSSHQTANNSYTNTTVSGFGDGYYQWYVNCTDNAGQWGVSETRVFTVDNQGPSVSLWYPDNEYYTNDNLTYFNFTGSDSLDETLNCSLYLDDSLYSNNGSAENGSVTSLIPESEIPDGKYEWYINCTDSAGNTVKSEVRNITIDTVAPSIHYTDSPPDNFNTSLNNVDVEFYFNDSLSPNSSCSMHASAGHELTIFHVLNYTDTNLSITIMPQGNHVYNISCTDLAGNVGHGTNRNIEVDWTPPTVVLNSPGNDTYSQATEYWMNWTAWDNIDPLLQCSLNLNGLPPAPPTPTVNNSWATDGIGGLSEGLHYWNVTCYDNALNSDTSVTYRFIVDYTNPLVTALGPVNSFNTSDNTTDFGFIYTDSLSPNASCTLLLDGIQYGQNVSVWNNTATNITSS
ncbi:right-handed parallel beta-helix repeat-containing protein, partial [Candidatus Woesearchaeota archaeon]|nr:right-handed parallel beta-helix repeat-containing protein [Candidatus Woesearchaeota archaeon]